jgi:hypothetical protein
LPNAIPDADLAFANAVAYTQPALSDPETDPSTERQLDSRCGRGIGHGGEL